MGVLMMEASAEASLVCCPEKQFLFDALWAVLLCVCAVVAVLLRYVVLAVLLRFGAALEIVLLFGAVG